jgi:hypothetical protein
MTREAQVTARVIDFNSKLRDKGYRFKDRDPVMDEICRMITDSGLSLQMPGVPTSKHEHGVIVTERMVLDKQRARAGLEAIKFTFA